MAGTPKLILAPVLLTTTLTTNVYNQGSALIYDLIKHIHILNQTGSAATFSLWLGLTGANTDGTEFIGTAKSVAANDVFDFYTPGVKVVSTQFIVGGAGTTLALIIMIAGEQYVV